MLTTFTWSCYAVAQGALGVILVQRVTSEPHRISVHVLRSLKVEYVRT